MIYRVVLYNLQFILSASEFCVIKLSGFIVAYLYEYKLNNLWFLTVFHYLHTVQIMCSCTVKTSLANQVTNACCNIDNASIINSMNKV